MSNEIRKKDWEEFSNSGMLWFVNRILHTFGWAIVREKLEDGTWTAYPARVKFRGFSEDCETRGFKRITDYMIDNAKTLKEEIMEDEDGK